ncbi:5'/3'-nucleotidase SurE [bacterium]|nr:5'/3'-nucleotidase SurE [bacterium]
MRILLTNDDGIHSPGLAALADALMAIGEVTVVAPDTERSAVGHSITISHPLRVKEVRMDGKIFGYAVNGTPADCIKIALGAIMDHHADMVVSGINQGLNTGTNIIYSGTVSGAMEGAILGLPALAVSTEVGEGTCICDNIDREAFSFQAAFTAQLAKTVMEKGLPERTFLNINIPSCPETGIRGIVFTKQGQSRFLDRFQKRMDPRQNIYYWLEGEDIEMEGGDELDYIAVKRGFISITPLWCDLTNYQYIERLKDWNLTVNI